jgi:signal transduction histidine kinase/ligand-binding sensor domain-containing protein
LIKKFDFDKLPVSIFDSSGFLPFANKPEVVQFNWDKLPDTVFNYENLPSKPLKFETSVLETPKLIKAGHPYLKTGASSLLYELGELQGLNGNITWLFEDRNGFLWIATDQGLYRYDGENFLLYFRDFLPSVIYRIVEDNRGNIWLGTIGNSANQEGNGLFVINTKAGIVKHLTVSQGLSGNTIRRMLSDNEGRIWISTQVEDVNIIDENTNTIKYFDRAQGLSNKLARGIIQDGKNNIWIATLGGGINIIDLKNGRIKYLKKEHGLNTDTLSSILMDSMNRIWITTNLGEMNAVDVQQGTIRYFNKDQGLGGDYITSLLNDRKGNIWIGTGRNGVKILHPEKGKLKTIKTVNGLSGDNIPSLVQDNLGQIWVATNAGLNIFNKSGNNIENSGKKEILTLAEDAYGQIWIGTYKGIDILDTATGLARSFTTANGLCNDTIQNMIVENGNVWIGTNNGIDIIDSARKTIQHFGKAQGLKTDAEPNMMKDKQGRMWLGAISYDAAGVDVLDQQKGTIRHLGNEMGLKDTLITDIKEDTQGQVWITTFKGGVYLIDPEKNTMKYMNDLPGLKDEYSKIFLPDHWGNMWIGTGKGIYVVNAKGDSLTAFSTKEGLINDNIISLNQYNGRIYVGTKGGLSIITPPSSLQKNWQVESFGKAQRISKIINSFGSDIITKKGLFLWGDVGITVLNNLTANITIPDTYVTGIDIFNQPQYFADKPWSRISENDTLWSSKKDTFFVNGKLPANTFFPQQDKMQWDSVANGYNMPENLHLPYYQNYLQFHFTQANLGSQDTTWYSYILQGKDKKWSDRTFNAYSQNYLNLPPGEYIFKVSGMYKGKWSEPGVFKFTISLPWWQTWWAYAVFIFIFSGLVWAFAQYRSRKLKRENTLLEEKITRRTIQLQHSIEELKSTQAQLIQSEKMASLGELTAGIAHEIQNPLNFVNNFSDVNTELIAEMEDEIDKGNIEEVKAIVNDIKENEQKINHHGKRADAIVKGMLQHSRASTGQKEPTGINALAGEYLRLAYHGLRAKDKSFNAEMKTNFDESIGNIDIIPQDIGRVLLNLYNNAFYAVNEKKEKQGENYEPTVSVFTKKNNGKIEISVKDNGNGIPQKVVEKIFQPFFTTKPTGQGTGLGLSLSYDIVKAHGGEIEVESREGEGSKFIITLPDKGHAAMN